jgi:hypothetical protein
MGLRILTGVLVVEPGRGADGSVVITFNPHGVTGNADGQGLTEWGDAGNFDGPPSAVVSLKAVNIADRNFFVPPPGVVDIELFRVREDAPTAAQIEVEWQATNGAQIREIAYMIIGEA